MKKFWILLLVLLLAISLTACGNDDPPPVEQEQQQEQAALPPAPPVSVDPPADEPDITVMLDDLAAELAAAFGSYNGQPLRWKVLQVDAENARALLISEHVLELRPYHSSSDIYGWQNSELYAWLNDEFYHNSFTAAEQAQIITDSGAKLLLPGQDDVINYFAADEERIGYLGEDTCQWWLRDAGAEDGYFMLVDDSGAVYSNGSVATSSYGVRPLLWLSLLQLEAPLHPLARLDDEVPEFHITFTDEIVISCEVSPATQLLLQQIPDQYLILQADWSINSMDGWKCSGDNDWADIFDIDYGPSVCLVNAGETLVQDSILRSNYSMPEENGYAEICYGVDDNGNGYLDLANNTIYFRLRFTGTVGETAIFSPWTPVFSIGGTGGLPGTDEQPDTDEQQGTDEQADAAGVGSGAPEGWPDNEYTRLVPTPDAGGTVLLKDTIGSLYTIDVDWSMEQGTEYAKQLAAAGFGEDAADKFAAYGYIDRTANGVNVQLLDLFGKVNISIMPVE
ncbi:MAG: hypothetical protein IKC76_07260 [Firmicutes bacterium]|nr:hypothetical protein [Bacillota bacterium]